MILTLQNKKRFQLSCFIITLLTHSLFAQLNIKSSSTSSNCNATGSVNIEVLGGKPPYCYDLSSCNNCYTCISQTSITYNALEAGKYYVTVTDNSIPAQTVMDSIIVEGNYMPPAIYASVNGCQVSAVITNGRPPFKYAISVDNGISYSPYQTDSIFSPVKGKYCIKVIDSCGNFSSYCSEIISKPLSISTICDTTLCKNGIKIDISSSSNGIPPYQKLIFISDKDTFNQDVSNFKGGDIFCLPPSCNWKILLEDVCKTTATNDLACSGLYSTSICHSCRDKSSKINGFNGVPPYKYYYFTTDNPTPIENPNGVDSNFYSNLVNFEDATFRIVDFCGNFYDLKPKCFEVTLKEFCDSSKTIIIPKNNNNLPNTFTCLTCFPEEIIVGDIAIFKNVIHPARFKISNVCDDLEIQEDLPKLTLIPKCNQILSSIGINYLSNTGSEITSDFSGGVYKLYDNTGKLITIDTNGVFDNIKSGKYIVEFECSGKGILKDSVDIGKFNITLRVSITSKLNSQGGCEPVYNLKATSNIPCDITDFSNNITETMKGNYTFNGFLGSAYLYPERQYKLKMGLDCADTLITMPKLNHKLEFIPPLCPLDGNLILKGAYSKLFWENWGKTETNILIRNKENDFYTLDCMYDFQKPNLCKADSIGKFTSQIPGSSHTAYLYLNKESGNSNSITFFGDYCPIDTLTFTFKPENYKKIDSINIDYIACQNNGLLSVKFRNGVPPYNTKIIDCINKNVILDTISNNQNLVFKDFKPGDYCFQFIDGCGNSIDYNKSVILPPDFFTNVSVGKCDSNIINLAVTTFEEANFIWKKLSNGSVFNEGINLNNAKYQLTNKLDTISLKIEFENCVLFEDTIVLKQPDLPIFSIKTLPITNCKHNLSYILDKVDKPFNLLWSNGAISDSISNLDNGKYTLTIIDKNGCSNTMEQLVSVDTPQIKLVERIVDCKANLQANVTNGNPPYTYRWFDLSVNDTIVGLDDGYYNLTVQDANGCKSVQSMAVLIPKFEIQLDTSDTSNCNKALVANIKNGIFTDPLKYLWDNNLISKSVIVSKSDFYKVTMTDARGCTDIDSIFVSSNNPELKVEKLNDLDCLSGAALHVSNGTKPLSFEWSDGFTSKDSIRYMKTGAYFVTVLDANGCRDTISFFNGDTINTKFKIYNAISPNGDLYNQKFVIEGIENYPQNKVIIYNRWGNEVYKKKNYTNLKGWEGKFTDEPLPDGTYFYYINLECLGKVFTGYIEIQR